MATEFMDITIGALDETESYRRSGGFLENVYNFSSVPSAKWAAIFEQKWEEIALFPKRHSRIENGKLVFVCLEHELTGYQMEAMVETIARTNAEYRRLLAGTQ